MAKTTDISNPIEEHGAAAAAGLAELAMAPAPSKALGYDDILGAQDINAVKVDVPDWKGAVWMRPLNGMELDKYQAEIDRRQNLTTGNYDLVGIRPYLLSLMLVNENGDLMFTTKEQLEALSKKRGSAIALLFAKAQEINATTPAEVDNIAKK